MAGPDDTTPPPPPALPPRRPAQRAAGRATAHGDAGQQSAAYVKGIHPLDPAKLINELTSDQLRALMSDNFAIWAQFSGIEVDNQKFDFDSHRYLLPIYQDMGQEVTLIKAAQMGATIYQLLFLLWWARHKTVKCAMYFPTGDGVKTLSKDRLNPLIKSNAELANAVHDDGNTLGLKQIDNVHGKMSSLYMLYMGGQASKDSVPLDVVMFDEVRLISPADIDQVIERVGHSRYKVMRFMSTAGIPNDDIHARFLRGTQLTWHTKCNCSEGVVLSDAFPDCMVVTATEVYLRCPYCLMRINDPQIGNYVAHNPGAQHNSYSISQLISRFITPKEIWQKWLTTTNRKEFYNAVLGKPYIDVENQPVTEGVLLACVNPELKWAYQHGAGAQHKQHCAMGVDQGGGYLYVTIARRGRDGKKEMVHLEIIESANPRYWVNGQPVTPFRRLYELMKEFDVRVCVLDAMPNHNEAADFARAFPARVFLAYYGEAGVDIVKWHDKLKPREQIRKGSKEIKLKWQVTINRYMGIDYALQEFVEGNIDLPHPDALVQTVRNTESGRFDAEPICRSRFFRMMSSLVREKMETDPETGRSKMQWKYTRGDPHFAHAQVYLQIALERMKRMPHFVMA